MPRCPRGWSPHMPMTPWLVVAAIQATVERTTHMGSPPPPPLSPTASLHPRTVPGLTSPMVALCTASPGRSPRSTGTRTGGQRTGPMPHCPNPSLMPMKSHPVPQVGTRQPRGSEAQASSPSPHLRVVRPRHQEGSQCVAEGRHGRFGGPGIAAACCGGRVREAKAGGQERGTTWAPWRGQSQLSLKG